MLLNAKVLQGMIWLSTWKSFGGAASHTYTPLSALPHEPVDGVPLSGNMGEERIHDSEHKILASCPSVVDADLAWALITSDEPIDGHDVERLDDDKSITCMQCCQCGGFAINMMCISLENPSRVNVRNAFQVFSMMTAGEGPDRGVNWFLVLLNTLGTKRD